MSSEKAAGRGEGQETGRLASPDPPADLPIFHKALKAHSISKTVAVSISDEPFRGRVLSRFSAACNLVDEAERVVSLVTSNVGNGPLNLVVEGQDPFAGIEAGVKARVDKHTIAVGDRLEVDLRGVVLWDPVVLWNEISAKAMAVLWDCVQERATSDSLLTFWVPAVRSLGGVRMAFQETARDAAERLLLALHQGQREGVMVYASKLAGLGPGTTPAGDDFLVGLMAGLRAWPRFLATSGLSTDDACVFVSEAATVRTRAFSAAHLRAAQAGQMSAGWHCLAAALAAGSETTIRHAADDLLALGATSGADAMAGFIGPYLLADSDET